MAKALTKSQIVGSIAETVGITRKQTGAVLEAIVALAYQGFTYSTQKRVADIGPIHATKEEKHTVPLPPVLGALLLVGGVILLVAGTGDRAA